MKKLILAICIVLLFAGAALAGDITSDLTTDIILSSQTSEKVNANWNTLNHAYQVMQEAVAIYDGKVTAKSYTTPADSIKAKIQAFLSGLTSDELEYLNWDRLAEEKAVVK